VVALGFEIEEGEKGDHGVDLRERNLGLFGDVFENFGGKVFMRMVFLDAFQNAEQRAGTAGVAGDGAVGEGLLFEGEGHEDLL
jgi:hypothetical protein